MKNNYIGIYFQITPQSYLSTKELYSKDLIVLFKLFKEINKTIILSSQKNLKKELEDAIIVNYEQFKFKDTVLPQNLILLKAKVHNSTIFSLKDSICYLKPKLFTEFKKETQCQNIEILDEELKIRIQQIIEILKLDKYLKDNLI